jgi:hypothetical protein
LAIYFTSSKIVDKLFNLRGKAIFHAQKIFLT